MDSRRHLNIGFLVAVAIVSVLWSGARSANAQKGATYVEMAADNCSGTKLSLELDGITPPPQARLIVTRRSDEQVVVDEPVSLGSDSRYHWSGVLAPLGKYRAQLFDANQKSVALGLSYAFNNDDILKEFIKGERGEIVHLTRGGNEPVTQQTEQKKLTVGSLPRSNGKNKLHIILMNQLNNKADEYFGSPPSSQLWESRLLPLGDYRVIVVEYNENEACTLITRK